MKPVLVYRIGRHLEGVLKGNPPRKIVRAGNLECSRRPPVNGIGPGTIELEPDPCRRLAGERPRRGGRSDASVRKKTVFRREDEGWKTDE
jgi:hypothetical protein